MPSRSEIQGMLQGSALRVTKPRAAVLSAVHDSPHADALSLTAAARAELGAVSHQAVYNVLAALTEAGLVRRVQPPGSVARYEARTGDNHHHAVCRSCGAIADVDCAVGEAPCLAASDDAGYAIDEAEVVYWGARRARRRERRSGNRRRTRAPTPGSSQLARPRRRPCPISGNEQKGERRD